MTARHVFVTGGTGYLGKRLIPALARRGHSVRAIVRPGSERRLPAQCEMVVSDVLSATSYRHLIAPCDTLVHLIGTPHPSPSKERQFQEIDLASVVAAVNAARHAGVKHFVYLSVAWPLPIMAGYVAVRQQGEALIRDSEIPATFLRPFYVLGPGHWWPTPLVPVFALLKHLPATRDGARRMAPVTLPAMIRTLVRSVENPPASGVREVNALDIR